MNHMKSIKPKDHPGENVEYCLDAILVYAERLESSRAFNPNHLGYIIHILEDTSYSRFHIWATQKYKDVIELIKKLCVCDKDSM